METLARENPSEKPEDVRATAMRLLKVADELTEKGATVAKHRSPLPVQKPVAKGSSSSLKQGAAQTEKRGSFNLFSWGKKQMDDIKENLNKFDEKFLAMQFEQEEKIKKAYDKTTADLSEMLTPQKKKNPNATSDSPTSPATPKLIETLQKDMDKAKEEVQTTMARFRSSFAGFTQKLVQPAAPKEPPSMDEQIVAELEQLHELMTLCHTLLAEKNDLINQIDYEPDPRLPYTIKKLEASLGRMDQLMESGIDGQFQDDTTQICVSTYERLILTLEKCNSPLVKSNAFAFTRDLEGDSEFDETATTPTTAELSSDTAASAESASKPAAEEAAVITTEGKPTGTAATSTDTTSPDPLLDDADMDIDLAAFEIGSDDEDDILNNLDDDEKKTDDTAAENKVNESTDDDFIKDMFV